MNEYINIKILKLSPCRASSLERLIDEDSFKEFIEFEAETVAKNKIMENKWRIKNCFKIEISKILKTDTNNVKWFCKIPYYISF